MDTIEEDTKHEEDTTGGGQAIVFLIGWGIFLQGVDGDLVFSLSRRRLEFPYDRHVWTSY